MNYPEALELAQKYIDLVRPGCLRIEIVGSVKRGDKQDVHDIEFLLIPDETRPALEFGKKIPPIKFYQVMDELCSKNMLKFVNGAARQRRYEILEVPVTKSILLNPFYLELYIVTRETWGVQSVIRTGPQDFSHAYVTNRSVTIFGKASKRYYYGLLPDDLAYLEGKTMICQGETILSLPEEKDAIEILGRGWVEPKDRMKILVPAPKPVYEDMELP